MIIRFCLFFFLILSAHIFAQTDSLTVKYAESDIIKKQFDNKALEKYKSDKSFDYTEEKVSDDPSFLEQIFTWLGRQLLRFLEWIFGAEDAGGIFATILSALPYIIAGIVLLLILKFFLKVNTNSIIQSGNINAKVAISNEEKLIKTKDLPKLIQKAIKQQNYRLAIRYYYLNILKHLENKELITWEQQKTNEDYLKEISEKSIKKMFKDLTYLYDFVWYGNFGINAVEFSKVQLDFESAEKLINKK